MWCASARRASGRTSTPSSTRPSRAPRSCWRRSPPCRTRSARSTLDFEKYQSDWFRIDQQYRWFTYAYQTADFQKPLEALKTEVDKQYANKFLYDFGGLWQQAMEPTGEWKSAALAPQAKFFDNHVAPVVKDGRTKAVVIISDGMRYEVAEELASLIRSEDRFDASLSAVLGVLPSYTQLGMASLLPQSTLELDPEALPVLADGKPTNGTANRDKILQARQGARHLSRRGAGHARRRAARALQAAPDLLRLPRP